MQNHPIRQKNAYTLSADTIENKKTLLESLSRNCRKSSKHTQTSKAVRSNVKLCIKENHGNNNRALRGSGRSLTASTLVFAMHCQARRYLFVQQQQQSTRARKTKTNKTKATLYEP